MHDHHHQLGPSRAGSVMLHLGPDNGALIIHTTAAEHLREIEISPDSDPSARRTHAAVRERVLPDRVMHAAVYPDLPIGRYTVWQDAATPHGTATISPAGITHYHW